MQLMTCIFFSIINTVISDNYMISETPSINHTITHSMSPSHSMIFYNSYGDTLAGSIIVTSILIIFLIFLILCIYFFTGTGK